MQRCAASPVPSHLPPCRPSSCLLNRLRPRLSATLHPCPSCRRVASLILAFSTQVCELGCLLLFVPDETRHAVEGHRSGQLLADAIPLICQLTLFTADFFTAHPMPLLPDVATFRAAAWQPLLPRPSDDSMRCSLTTQVMKDGCRALQQHAGDGMLAGASIASSIGHSTTLAARARAPPGDPPNNPSFSTCSLHTSLAFAPVVRVRSCARRLADGFDVHSEALGQVWNPRVYMPCT